MKHLIFLVLCAVNLSAQDCYFFKVYGTVLNMQKVGLPDRVVLIESDNTAPHKVVTDLNGFYSHTLCLPRDKRTVVRLSVADECTQSPVEVKLKAFEGSALQDLVICTDKLVASPCDVRYAFNSLGDRTFEFYVKTPSTLALRYFWNFGDGNTAEGPQTKHQYEKDGVYEVVLKVQGPNCDKEYRFKVEVKSANNPPPGQSFGASCCGKINISPTPAANVAAFTYLFSVGADFRFKLVEWDFGDGETTSSPDPQVKHTYKQAGRYLVKAKIIGEHCTIELSVWVSIHRVVNPPNPCNIDFVYKTDNLNAAFQLTTKVKPDKIEWSFGDGATSNEISPVHTYKKPGVYLVQVVVSFAGVICKAEKSIEIKSGVVTPPVAEIAIIGTNPNPVLGDEMFVEIKSNGKFSVTLVIGDYTGNYVHKQLVDLEPGINFVSVNTHLLKPGSYVINLFYENNVVSKWRFVKI